MSKTIKGFPLYLIYAILANIFYYALLIPAAFLYPEYSPFLHTVSALGNTEKNPNGWFLFSISLILIGIVLVPYFFDLKKWYESQPTFKRIIMAIQVIGYFNSFSLFMIAIFPTNTASFLHGFWSLMNFLCIELVILLVVIGLRKHPSYWRHISTVAVVDFVLCITYLTLLRVYREIATIFEWLTFIFALGIILLIGLNMYKTSL